MSRPRRQAADAQTRPEDAFRRSLRTLEHELDEGIAKSLDEFTARVAETLTKLRRRIDDTN